jgi:nucleotide-binding universal stress UspA family protein
VILVGTDLGEDGDDAVELARGWADRLKVPLTIVHVLPEPMRSEMLFPQQNAKNALSALDLRRAVEDHLAPRVREKDRLRLVEGSAGEQLVALARELRAELIVLGGHEPSRERVFGSVAEHVLANAHRPVMIARRHAHGPVIVALALEGEPEPQLEVGVRVAETIGARVLAAHILREPLSPEGGAAMLRAQRQLPEGTEIQLERGEPAKEIVALAERAGAELIVTATHSRTGLARFVTGSVASAIVRRASCSVLVVPLRQE